MPEKHRSYARPSRRQSSTPDIPRPGWHQPEEQIHRCTFGVVIDTSGSMERPLLGKALGAIASYAIAREVPQARVVFCDAAAYDAGYLDVEAIAGRVTVRGRGGTVLQPGVALLERAEDFPADAPILVITDAECDMVRIRREHAFLVPPGARLPFTPRGPVFHMSP
jgi:predicted metal-dependent peptidase